MAIRWKSQPPLPDVLPEYEQWVRSETGQTVTRIEQELVNRALVQCFGYHLLQLSVNRYCDLAAESRIQRVYRAHPQASPDDHQLHCEFTDLPFATDSLDCVLLHHVQEYVANPHVLLREVQRVVVPRGHLILVGFNPWSVTGVRAAASRFLPGMTWHNHLLSCSRMVDWMELLGFTVDEVCFGYRRPALRKFQRLPLGNIYVISAVKEVAAISPPRRRWQSVKAGFALAPAKTPVAGRHPGRITNRNSM